MKKQPSTSWGNVAEWYDDLLETEKDTYQSAVILPNLLRLLSVKKGQKILDLACGQGFFSRAFAKEGASVTGVDVAEELIRRATAHAAKEKIKNLSFAVA
ncbi:MAG: methyltransferase domain-containing protein, partial [Patescibacteria group bacterium]